MKVGWKRLPRETWWRAQDYTYAVRCQLVDPRVDSVLPRPAHPIGRPVVLVPGVYEPWQFLLPLARRLVARGLVVHTVPELGRNGAPVSEQARVLGAVLVERDLRDVLLVAHSKGGLIGKLAMLTSDPEGRIAAMVAVNSPYAGTPLARWFPTRAVRAFSPSDPTLRALAAEREVDARITALRSVWDPHIPGAGALGGAADVVLRTPGHFRALEDPAVVQVVVDTACATDPRPDA
ncbi:esterase/lipase family protein [Cellulomonas composti]|uniref:Alpha/beta hydrolase n=1 Tax=Cellulomonas composti TaxID=266130 RepID=A0A511JB54_9CELL|nr:lipase [Cellulomonas composti]GEL95019.1 hypothetical protein CCO02nite_16770 [Cellulomonas composti]